MKTRALNLESLVRENVRGLEPYHSARESIQEGVLLDANENPSLREVNGLPVNRYPDPFQWKLRETLAEWLDLQAEQLLAGAGSDEVLDWIFKVFCQPDKDQVAIAEPTYGMYRVMAEIYGVEIFNWNLNEDFDFEAEPFRKTVPAEVKVLFLCSPNNPTGNLLSSSQILRLAQDWDKIVVVDEAYVEFADSDSLAREVRHYPNLVIMRTFSKALGRAGIRLGYVVADPRLIHFFSKVKAPYNLNSLSLREGIQGIEDVDKDLPQLARILGERARVRSELQRIPQVEKVFPSDANFLLFRCQGASKLCRRLAQRGIIVRDRTSLPGLMNCIRVTIGTPEENTMFLETLVQEME